MGATICGRCAVWVVSTGAALLLGHAYAQPAESVEVVGGNVYNVAAGVRLQLTDMRRDREAALAPDGRSVAFVRATPGLETESALGTVQLTELRTIGVDGSGERLLLAGRPAAQGSSEPPLADFSNPHFAPDGRRIYFESAGGVTQRSVQAVDFTGDVQRLAAGSIVAVLPGGSGSYAGHVAVVQHRYWVGGGSYDWAWLIAPDGREVGPLGDPLEAGFEQRLEGLRAGIQQGVAAQSLTADRAVAWAGLPPDCWTEPRTYHSSGDDWRWRSRTTIERVNVARPEVVTYSPNKGYFFALAEPTPRRTILLSAEKERLVRITFTDAIALDDAKWINEKLVAMRVWWGRVAATDLIFDVEREQFIYDESVHDGAIVMEQARESCPLLGGCRCIR